MSLLRSKAMRVFTSVGGILADQTEAARTWDAPALPAPIQVGDYLYIGKNHAFNHLYVAMDTPNSNTGTLSCQYWTGAFWKDATSFMDETQGLSVSGFLSMPEYDENYAWEKWYTNRIPELATIGINSLLFWIRYKISSPASIDTAIGSVKTLFSDDRLMTTIYPEVMNYLPATQANFYPQHELAKDSIVNECIVKGLIDYEEQIKNPDEWMLAATYRCIELILDPIPGDDRLNIVKKEMARKAEKAILTSAASLDRDKNEHEDLDEREPGKLNELCR